MKFEFVKMKAIWFLLFALLTLSVTAQQKVITGKVTDRSGSPIPGVTIVVKGTGTGAPTGTVTDMDGKYSVSVPASIKELNFSFVGMKSIVETINGRTVIDVVLEEDRILVSDVIVIAYGTSKKSDLTGTITAVTAKEFQKGNIASSEQLLMGKVTGLQITSSGGAAGGGSTIRIRGGASLNASNDPLIVVDGVPVESNGLSGSANLLNTINPNDIESISVLKDASATALYGSRASNGVLIITTKKGAAGAVKFNFNTQASVGMVAKYVDVLDGDQIRSIINNDASVTGNNTFKNLLGTANTDWQKEIYQTALSFDNNLSASGSIKNIPFRISTGYLTQDGVLKTNNFKRFTGALNLSPKFFTNHLSVNLNAKYSNTQNRFADEGGAIGGAVSFDPTQPVMKDGSVYGGYYEWLGADGKPINTNGGAVAPNPLGLLEQRDNTSQVDRLIGNIQLDYKLHFLPDLHVMLNLGLDKATGSGNDNRPKTMASVAYKNGIYSYYKQGKSNTLADVSLFYSKELTEVKSKFDLLVGHSYQDFYTDVYNYASYSQDGVVDATTVPRFATDKPEYRLESYLGRLNYTFNNKYLLTASMRRDASSKFSPDTRVGYFPAVALAWKMKDEFFKNSEVVSDLKFRLGWGITGQQDLGSNYYPYQPRYSQSESTAQYQFGNAFYSFQRPVAYDANIKWETTTTNNIGLDFGFFKGRISGSADVYKKKTKDLLSIVPIAPGANFDIELTTNVGNMENKGVEFTLNTIPVQTTNFSWNFGFNVTYNETKITKLLKTSVPGYTGIDVGNVSGGTGNKIGKHAVGYAPNTFFVYKQVYDKMGAPIEGLYEDINRDGQITEADRYYFKKPAPDFMFGVNTSFTYKKWSMGLVGHAMIGNYLYNNFNSNKGTFRAMKDPLLFLDNVSTSYLKTNFTNMQYLSDYYIENASFFRLDNVNFGYNAGKVFKNRTSELRITASVQNVFVITNYSGLDPEYNPSDLTKVGVDNVIYPRPRIFSIGFNLDF